MTSPLPPLSTEGFLLKLEDWSESVAEALATQDNLTLTQNHWVVIRALRWFYLEFELTPAMRVLIKQLRDKGKEEKFGPFAQGFEVTSANLQALFPKGIYRQGSRLGGLPKPARCT